ncbi:LacI family DNA-binding transcriptional regulator [Anaerobium acetethylicum]|uniref:LacI family transcriptional regulator n=1 Tax=Anaerobium acetethylicum TaxID=1619234 RepID=A0A1D3TYW7_9FIRM|nr:LacI family DNA-binding transcriptional regulator [Anaerobium acetethylicum]SCP99710.1 LacI family transcriptional regulator [Anaerobium acetethylicum]
MAVTIKQIAELANVSRGTVDKVLNERPGVKDATRQKVLKIAHELNYQPNFLGKALVQSKNPIKIGIILTPEYNPFIQKMLVGVQNAQNEFSAFGIETSVKMPISLEPAEQISILNSLESEGVEGIAVFPLDDDAVRNKINQLIDKGIAVITFNSKIEGTNDFCFVGQNHHKAGRIAAGLLMKLLPPEGDVGIIISSHYLSCHRDRLQGFLEKLKDSSSSINVFDVQENQDRKDEAFKITLEYCNQHPQLNGLYITGGGVSGVGSALSLLNLSHKVAVICHDLVPDTLELLQNGTVDFALGQSPEYQGYLLVKILFEYLVKKQEPTSRNIDVPITIETQDTI